MASQIHHSAIWALVERQHGVVARRQLLDAGLTPSAIRHRVQRGRLHPWAAGIYAVGRPDLADARDLLEAEALHRALGDLSGRRGVRVVRGLLEASTFRLTDSELERRFLRLVHQAGLALPETQRYVSTHRVDFVRPDLGLVVETDSLRYHRTPLEQTRDRARDHAHLAAGLAAVRFTHHQVRWEPEHVLGGLADGARMAEAAYDLRRPR